MAGVFESRVKTTATTFSHPRGDSLNMRRRHPDLSVWWRRWFGQRLPFHAGFQSPGPNLFGRFDSIPRNAI